MKLINILIFAQIITLCSSCTINQKLSKQVKKCDTCRVFFMSNPYFDYPKREVDKVLHATPLNLDVPPNVKDTFHVLIPQESKQLTEHLFCFLGMENDKMINYFHPQLVDSEKPIMRHNSNLKILTLSYNSGNYYKKERGMNIPTTIEEGTEFWLKGGGFTTLYFSKQGNNYIYTGTNNDSTNLLQCINRKN